MPGPSLAGNSGRVGRHTRFVLLACATGLVAAYLGLLVLREGVATVPPGRRWLVYLAPAFAFGLVAGAILILPSVLVRRCGPTPPRP